MVVTFRMAHGPPPAAPLGAQAAHAVSDGWSTVPCVRVWFWSRRLTITWTAAWTATKPICDLEECEMEWVPQRLSSRGGVPWQAKDLWVTV